MSTGYKIAEQDELFYLTLQVVDWVDLFTRKEYRDLIVKNLIVKSIRTWNSLPM